MIVRFLKWALSLFQDKAAQVEVAPFPAKEASKPKTKPRVAKATTRKPAAKTAPAAKRTTAKKVK
jgi:hypothetical protein